MEPPTNIRFARKPNCRKRASKACLKCRKRKVRCDVTRTAQPCTNCRLDGAECTVILKERSCGEAAPRDLDHSVEADLLSQISGDIHGLGYPDLEWAIGRDGQTAEDSHRYLDNETSRWHADMNLASGNSLQDPAQLALPSSIPDEGSLDAAGSWMKLGYEKAKFSRVDFLESQMCFHVPAEPLLDEFLRHYFLFVHPMLPMLNEGMFWEDYEISTVFGDYNQHRVPILLLQAMLFAASPFVPEETLQALGFQNTMSAKECFYGKAKLLYESCTEPDHVSMAQASLLLTYWCPHGSNEEKANTSWLKAAIKHAMALGAHKYADSPRRKDVLKRIWWCCIVRDRIMPLCLRRRIHITRGDFDFDTHEPPSVEDLLDEGSRSKVYSSLEQRSVMTITALMIDLCVCLTDVFELMYPIADVSGLDVRKLSSRLKQTRENKNHLRRWLKKAVRASLASADVQQGRCTAESEPSASSVTLYANLLWIYYHSSLVALCNHELHLLATATLTLRGINVKAQLAMIENTRNELRRASNSIAERLDQLLKLRLAKWLPSSAVGCTALPLALHMLEIKLCSSWFDSHAGISMVESQSRLNVLIQAMREYYPRHEGVIWISKVIRYFMECTYLDEPALPHWDPLVSKDSAQGQREGWSETMADVTGRSPTCYLKMALTIDLSLSNDRLPEERDFPAGLRPLMSQTGCFMPILFKGDDGPAAKADTRPSPQLDLAGSVPPASLFQDISGWIENDRSLYFALEMGLAPKKIA
ncbi:hypothetical protein ACJZ2D_009180 [Fusarium nematophilum]